MIEFQFTLFESKENSITFRFLVNLLGYVIIDEKIFINRGYDSYHRFDILEFLKGKIKI